MREWHDAKIYKTNLSCKKLRTGVTTGAWRRDSLERGVRELPVFCILIAYTCICLSKCSECAFKMVHFTANFTSKEKCQQILNSKINDMPWKDLGEVY